MGPAGAVAAQPEASAGWSLGRPPDGDQRGVLADPLRAAVARRATELRALEDRLQPASPLVNRWHLGRAARRGAPRRGPGRGGGVGRWGWPPGWAPPPGRRPGPPPGRRSWARRGWRPP